MFFDLLRPYALPDEPCSGKPISDAIRGIRKNQRRVNQAHTEVPARFRPNTHIGAPRWIALERTFELHPFAPPLAEEKQSAATLTLAGVLALMG